MKSNKAEASRSQKSLDKVKRAAVEAIENGNFLILFYEDDNNVVSYIDHNLSNAQAIVGCEVVKAKFLKKVAAK